MSLAELQSSGQFIFAKININNTMMNWCAFLQNIRLYQKYFHFYKPLTQTKFYIYLSKDYDATILIYYQYYAAVQLASDFIMTDPMTDSGNFMALF